MSLPVVSLLVFVSIVAIVFLTSKLKLNAFVSLFIVSLFLAITTMPEKDIIKIIKDGFGGTTASIGFLIILGAIIAVILDKTGGALSIARYILSKTGEKNAPAALGITGFIAGMPIFCDSGFIILSGLAKSFSSRTGIAMPLIAGVLASSLYSVHCLIPPHPGALAAAGIMDVPIGNMILIGILFAIPAALSAYFWIKWVTRGKNYLPATSDQPESHMDITPSPPVWLALLPIVMPLFLISLNSLFTILYPGSGNGVIRFLVFIGQPIIALAIGVVLSFPMIRNRGMESLNGFFDSALEKAGPIIIVTAAGGMFGMVIKETGIGAEAGKLLSQAGISLLVPFLIALVMKTAQGSSTVAIITASSFVAPMMTQLGLDSEWGKMLTLLSLGAGSMVVSHANDSYFWVVSRFSEITPAVTMKVHTSATAVMGITVFICVWITSLFLL
jgi:gluconate:H+ symporter, GntP family